MATHFCLVPKLTMRRCTSPLLPYAFMVFPETTLNCVSALCSTSSNPPRQQYCRYSASSFIYVFCSAGCQQVLFMFVQRGFVKHFSNADRRSPCITCSYISPLTLRRMRDGVLISWPRYRSLRSRAGHAFYCALCVILHKLKVQCDNYLYAVGYKRWLSNIHFLNLQYEPHGPGQRNRQSDSLGKGGPGIETLQGQDVPHSSRLARPGSGVDHPLPSNAEVKPKAEYTYIALWAFVACSRVNFTFT